MFEKLSYYMDNGFKVVMHRDKSIKVVTAGVIVNYGSMYETDEDNGIAHFIEHILASDNQDGSRMSVNMEKMRDSGAIYNAQTDKENTAFYIYGMSDNLQLYLELLSELVFQHREFKDSVFDNEKKVVERELVSYYSSFSQISGRAVQALYSDAGVGRIIVGKRNNIREFTKEMVLQKIKDVYVPENSAVVICGDFQYDEAKELIEKYFGCIQDETMKKSMEPVQITPGYFFNPNFNGENSILSLCYRKITNENRNKIANSVELFLKAMLDPILFKRMGYMLRIKKGLSYNMGGFGNFTGRFLALGVTAVFNSDKLTDVFDIMQESLNEMREKGFTQEELEKAKRNTITSRMYKNNDVKEQAFQLLKRAKSAYSYSPDNEIREIKLLQLEEVNNVLYDILAPENLGFACIGRCAFDTIIEKFVV